MSASSSSSLVSSFNVVSLVPISGGEEPEHNRNSFVNVAEPSASIYADAAAADDDDDDGYDDDYAYAFMVCTATIIFSWLYLQCDDDDDGDADVHLDSGGMYIVSDVPLSDFPRHHLLSS